MRNKPVCRLVLLVPIFLLFVAAVCDLLPAALLSLLLVLFALVAAFSAVERRETATRRLVILAVMTALSVTGRFVFAPVPGFKPITALVVITALSLGGEAGFLCGALSACISNFYFGQGPWTPFQMLVWGGIGLLAGWLAAPLRTHRTLLLVYGAVAGMLYSAIMDIWTVLWYDSQFSWRLYGAALLSALPYTLLYAASNIVFLLLLAKPVGEKLDRLHVKYGI